jgi:hypothetical protein
MTAPLFNLPITNPVVGPSAATNGGQGALGGFEALLAAFFGPTDQTATAGAGLFAPPADGEATDGAEGDQKPAGDVGVTDPAASTPPPTADAMTMAALLVAPQVVAQPVQAAPAQGGDVSDNPAAPTPPSPTAAFIPSTPADETLAASAPKTASLPAEPANTPQGVQPPLTEAALAAAPPAKPVAAEPPPAEPHTKPAAAAAPTPQPQPQPQPQIAAAPQGPAAGAAGAAPQAELAQAEAAAPAVAEEAKPQEQTPARPARHADAARRRDAGVQPGAASPADDGVVAPNAVTAAANASDAGKATAALETEIAPLAPKEAKSEPAAAGDTPDVQVPAPAAPAAHAHATGQAAPVRATSETIANLTAQISKKLEGRATKFDVELTPAGLGHVSVSVEIAASGKMTAAMSFDSPQAAAEVRARSHELQRALEQAGFDLTGGLSFDVNDRGGDGRGLAQQQQQNDGAWRGRAFQAVLGTAGEAAETAALQYARRSETGVDIRI